MDRNLDGIYFRVNRDGKWDNVCFSDLDEPEMIEAMTDKDITWIKSLCIILGKRIKEIGDEFDLAAG